MRKTVSVSNIWREKMTTILIDGKPAVTFFDLDEYAAASVREEVPGMGKALDYYADWADRLADIATGDDPDPDIADISKPMRAGILEISTIAAAVPEIEADLMALADSLGHLITEDAQDEYDPGLYLATLASVLRGEHG